MEVTVAKKSSQKRDLVKGKSNASYAKRKTDGTFKEMDSVGRSQKADRRTKAKNAVKPGFGDQGDQKRKGTKQASLTRGKADPGALKDVADVETPQKPGRRMKTAAKSGYANLVPKSVKQGTL